MSAHCASSMTKTNGADCDKTLDQESPPREQLVARKTLAVVQPDEAADPGDEVVPLDRVVEVAGKSVGDLGGHHVTGVLVSDAEPSPHDLGEGRVGDAVAVARAPAQVPQQGVGDAVGVLLELPDQA